MTSRTFHFNFVGLKPNFIDNYFTVQTAIYDYGTSLLKKQRALTIILNGQEMLATSRSEFLTSLQTLASLIDEQTQHLHFTIADVDSVVNVLAKENVAKFFNAETGGVAAGGVVAKPKRAYVKRKLLANTTAPSKKHIS